MFRLSLLLALIPLSACQTLSEIDKGLYSVSEAVTDEDRVTGKRAINLTSRQEQIQKSGENDQKFLSLIKSKNIKINEELDRDVYLRIKQIFNKVHAVSHLRDEDWTLILIPDEKYNAFVTGGTYVYVHLGLVQQAKDDDEIAIVLGHELAHVAANHVYESKAHQQLAYLTKRKEVKKQGYNEAYSNLDEQEADQIGTMYAALAGFDPYAAVRTWERESEKSKHYDYTYFASHPYHSERAVQTKKYANIAAKYYRKGMQNPNSSQLISCNELWCKKKGGISKGGDGSGLFSILDTALEAYGKHQNASIERTRQEINILRKQRGLKPLEKRSYASNNNQNFPISFWRTYRGTISVNGSHQTQEIKLKFNKNISNGMVTATYKTPNMRYNEEGRMMMKKVIDPNTFLFDWQVKNVSGISALNFSSNKQVITGTWAQNENDRMGLIRASYR